MSAKDLTKFTVIKDFLGSRVTRAQAALMLDLSERQITRMGKAVRAKGLLGVVHGNRGKIPHNRSSMLEQRRAADAASRTYFDFNTTHAHERVKADGLTDKSYWTFRRWCRKRGVAKKTYRRRKSKRTCRARVHAEGLMIQFDGSRSFGDATKQ